MSPLGGPSEKCVDTTHDSNNGANVECLCKCIASSIGLGREERGRRRRREEEEEEEEGGEREEEGGEGGGGRREEGEGRGTLRYQTQTSSQHVTLTAAAEQAE